MAAKKPQTQPNRAYVDRRRTAMAANTKLEGLLNRAQELHCPECGYLSLVATYTYHGALVECERALCRFHPRR